MQVKCAGALDRPLHEGEGIALHYLGGGGNASLDARALAVTAANVLAHAREADPDPVWVARGLITELKVVDGPAANEANKGDLDARGETAHRHGDPLPTVSTLTTRVLSGLRTVSPGVRRTGARSPAPAAAPAAASAMSAVA